MADRYPCLRPATATALLVVLATLCGCGPSGASIDGAGGDATDDGGQQPLPADAVSIEFLDGGDVLMTVTEEGTGGLTARGTYDDDSVTVTAIAVDTGDGDFTATFDAEGRPDRATLPNGDVISMSHNADGTFNYEWVSAGELVFTGANVAPADEGTLPAKEAVRLAGVSPADVLECSDRFLEHGAAAVCSDGGVPVTGDAGNSLMFERLKGTGYDRLCVSVCYLSQAFEARTDEMHERCKRYLPGPNATDEERREAYARREDCDEWVDDLEESQAWVHGLLTAIIGGAADELVSHLALEQAEMRELCGYPPLDGDEEEPGGGGEDEITYTCRDSSAGTFANGGFEDVIPGPEGFLAAWESTSGQPVVHPTKIGDEPASMPPGLNAQGDYYIELPPGAGIAQTFATEPDNAYAISFRIAAWSGPQPLIRTNVTYAYDENGEPVIGTQDQYQPIAQDPTATTQRRWGAVCPSSTLEIINLAEQSVFLDDVSIRISNRGER